MKITRFIYKGAEIRRKALEISEVVALIASEKTEEMVRKFRKNWELVRPMDAIALKRRLPHLFFGGVFRKNKQASFSGYVLLEFCNQKDATEAERIKEVLTACPNVLLAMEGAMERSLVVIVPYCRPDGSLPTEEPDRKAFLAHAYRHAVKMLEPMVSAAVTLKEPTLEQDCLLGYDARVLYNAEAVAVHIEQPTMMPEESVYQEHYEKMKTMPESEATLYSKHRFCAMQYDAALSEAIVHNGESLKNGDFKSLLVHTARQCFKSGIEEEACVKWNVLYLGTFVSEAEIRNTVSNIYTIEHGFGGKPLYNSTQVLSARLEEFMQRRYELRYNLMTNSAECRERDSFCFEFVPVDARKLNSIVMNALAEGINVWNRDVERYVKSDRLPNYRPIEDYLHRLPKWDGKERIRPLMNRVQCRNPRWEDFSYRWFLSMVAHWQGRDKEHGNALSPLLIGGQGFRKSTFCKSLLPPELQTYYTDSIDFSKKRDAELSLTRFALINLDEFDQTNEQHQAFLKYLLQTSVVSTRKPYGSQVETIKRYASFIGTSNHADLLNDLSGSRRFLCVEVKQPIDTSQPVEHEQLYAQAVAALDKGERYWLTFEEEQQLMQDNEQFRQRPMSEELFFRYFRPAEHDGEGVWRTAGEIYEMLQQKSGIKLPQSKKSHFGRFLKKTLPQSLNDRRGALYRVVEV